MQKICKLILLFYTVQTASKLFLAFQFTSFKSWTILLTLLNKIKVHEKVVFTILGYCIIDLRSAN